MRIIQSHCLEQRHAVCFFSNNLYVCGMTYRPNLWTLLCILIGYKNSRMFMFAKKELTFHWDGRRNKQRPHYCTEKRRWTHWVLGQGCHGELVLGLLWLTWAVILLTSGCQGKTRHACGTFETVYLLTSLNCLDCSWMLSIHRIF